MLPTGIVQPLQAPSRPGSGTERLINHLLHRLRPVFGKGLFGLAATEFLAFGLKQAYAASSADCCSQSSF